MHSLVEMLRYKRPEGSVTQKSFCKRFLEPTFGKPDKFGNYIKIIGDKPNVCFTAHHDTVHFKEGFQKLIIMNDVVSISNHADSNCLGADCTTGVYILLCMIESRIAGTYVVHAAEELGCRGSGGLIQDKPDWLQHTDAVISFDRYGDKSVITHQMGYRTCSDEFATSFADALDMPQLVGDNGGSYTDSNEYANVVSECTNISVGYYNQHSKNETQDLVYLDKLVSQLISADWSKLVICRDPEVVDDLYQYDQSYYGYSSYRTEAEQDFDALESIIAQYPFEVTKLLYEYGFTAEALVDELRLPDYNYINDYARRRYK